MFRFTIRDLLWLTAFVAVVIAWLNDRDKIRHMRRDGEQMTKRAADLKSQAKMWQNEADKAIELDNFLQVHAANRAASPTTP
jgi:hypothetical protein